MSRISRHQMFMGIARVVSMRSTCCRLNVGAVLVDQQHRILSLGYNGAPAGEPHCGGKTCKYHTTMGCKVIHAEVNALTRAPTGPLAGATLYVTHSPCFDCARRIVQMGIQRVIYETEYRLADPINILSRDIEVYRLLPSGYLLNQQTGDIIEGPDATA